MAAVHVLRSADLLETETVRTLNRTDTVGILHQHPEDLRTADLLPGLDRRDLLTRLRQQHFGYALRLRRELVIRLGVRQAERSKNRKTGSSLHFDHLTSP